MSPGLFNYNVREGGSFQMLYFSVKMDRKSPKGQGALGGVGICRSYVWQMSKLVSSVLDIFFEKISEASKLSVWHQNE